MFAAGDTLDHYRLDAQIARGGMATLFRATDLRDGRTVALKLPHAEMEADAVLMERFRREQEIGEELDHPGIVKAFAVPDQSRPYMVVEWVEGRLLREVLVLGTADPFSIDRATHLALQILDALDAMHTHGVVHRDLKPENVMVDEDDGIKLIDFGIAMKEDARRITHVGMSPLLGTPDYIAPEQVKGQQGDQRSDLYSMGAMLYEMLAGRPPFTGPNPLAVMNERVLRDPTPLRTLRPEVSRELEEIVSRAMERNPRRRYQTASEMALELEHQDRVGDEVGVGAEERTSLRDALRKRGLPRARRLWLYAAMVLGPVFIFALMMALHAAE